MPKKYNEQDNRAQQGQVTGLPKGAPVVPTVLPSQYVAPAQSPPRVTSTPTYVEAAARARQTARETARAQEPPPQQPSAPAAGTAIPAAAQGSYATLGPVGSAQPMQSDPNREARVAAAMEMAAPVERRVMAGEPSDPSRPPGSQEGYGPVSEPVVFDDKEYPEGELPVPPPGWGEAPPADSSDQVTDASEQVSGVADSVAAAAAAASGGESGGPLDDFEYSMTDDIIDAKINSETAKLKRENALTRRKMMARASMMGYGASGMAQADMGSFDAAANVEIFQTAADIWYEGKKIQIQEKQEHIRNQIAIAEAQKNREHAERLKQMVLDADEELNILEMSFETPEQLAEMLGVAGLDADSIRQMQLDILNAPNQKEAMKAGLGAVTVSKGKLYYWGSEGAPEKGQHFDDLNDTQKAVLLEMFEAERYDWGGIPISEWLSIKYGISSEGVTQFDEPSGLGPGAEGAY